MKVAADFRKTAREALKGNWFAAVLAGVIASLLGAGNKIGPDLQYTRSAEQAKISIDHVGMPIYSTGISDANAEQIRDFLFAAIPYISILIIVMLIVQLIIGGIVSAGYCKFNLDLVDGEAPQLGTLFTYLPQWKTMVSANIQMTIYTLLWTLLFIIPGIVAAYRYSMTYYILAENPELNASEAIERSVELMNGNKWRLFCLGFSFIGWNILCALTLGIGSLWLNPYIQTANAAFYRDITASSAQKEGHIPLLASAEGY